MRRSQSRFARTLARAMPRLAPPAALAAVLGAGVTGCSAEAAEPDRTAAAKSEIIAGYPDALDKAVFTVGVSHARTAHCSGTLIAPNLVLTARHCVANSTGEDPERGILCPETRFLSAPEGDFFFASPDGRSLFTGRGKVNLPAANAFCGNDIAVIQLEERVPDSVAKPFTPRVARKTVRDENYSAVGYGLTNPKDPRSSGERMRVDDNIVRCSGTDCDSDVSSYLAPGEWIGTARTCQGDSGGPALDENGEVIGVLSRGPDGCYSSVYTDVAAWKTLLVDSAVAAAQAGGYDPPDWTTPLGESCTGPCAQGFVCLSEGESTGKCVPPCSASGSRCPSGYTCDSKLNACSDSIAPPRRSKDGGCAVGHPSPVSDRLGWSLSALAVAALIFARRRRS